MVTFEEQKALTTNFSGWLDSGTCWVFWHPKHWFVILFLERNWICLVHLCYIELSIDKLWIFQNCLQLGENFTFLSDVSDRFLKQCTQIRKNLCKLLHILHTVPVNLISIFGLHLIFIVISIWKTVLWTFFNVLISPYLFPLWAFELYLMFLWVNKSNIKYCPLGTYLVLG